MTSGRRLSEPVQALTPESPVPQLTREELAKIDYHNRSFSLGKYSAKGKLADKGKSVEKGKNVAKTGVRSDPSHVFKKDQTDRAAADKDARDRAAAAAFIESHHARTSPGTYPGRARPFNRNGGTRRGRDEDEDPDTPRSIHDGPYGHYADGVFPRVHANEGEVDPEAVLNEMVHRANQALHEIVRIQERIRDPELRHELAEIITHLTNCLRATNLAREAYYLVSEATNRLDLLTIGVSGRALAAIGNATGTASGPGPAH
jgi:hypothetical protein